MPRTETRLFKQNDYVNYKAFFGIQCAIYCTGFEKALKIGTLTFKVNAPLIMHWASGHHDNV